MEKDQDKIWEEIHEDYLSDEYPIFGGPFTDAISFYEWLKKYYEPPILITQE